jgi:hypothetical protein
MLASNCAFPKGSWSTCLQHWRFGCGRTPASQADVRCPVTGSNQVPATKISYFLKCCTMLFLNRHKSLSLKAASKRKPPKIL